MVNFYRKNIFILACLSICFFSSLLLVAPIGVAANMAPEVKDNFQNSLGDTGEGVGYKVDEEGEESNTTEKIASIIGTGIAAVISFIGVIFFILIFMGALDIIGAGGDDEKVLDGKKKIKNGAIGVLIVFTSYLFADLLLKLITGNFSGSVVFKIGG